FLADESANAYERLIERLLESPHYGERWGRHWLDAAGYADSEGYTNNDAVRPWAYKYRDWVVRALNADMPVDQFIVWQLAGDELVPPPHTNLSAEQIDMLTATGFLRMAADGTGSGANDDAARNQTIADTIKIVSTSLMGLSVGCAQCHDHRYDPIPQTDYYRLRSVFAPALDWKAWKPPQQRLVSLYTDADRAAAAEAEAAAGKIAEEKNAKQTEYLAAALEQELAKFDETLREKLRAAYKTPDAERTDEQKQLLKEHPSVNISPGVLYQYNQAAADDLKKYDERIAAERAKKPIEEFVRALAEPPGHAPVTHLFYRGEFNQPLEAVEPGDLTIAAPPGERFTTAANDESLPTTGRRLGFARHLVDGNHPLLARVLVNRVWMHHFGRGLVGTPADFGVLGERPTHPELLDWLATEFMADGWSLKRLHRRIMLSTVYRQSSAFDPEKAAVDGANLLYWRKPIVRLDAEAIRDRVLAAAGSLDDSMFGPPVAMKPDDTGQIVEEGEPRRRSIYLQVRRSQPHAMLTSFDAPVMETNCDRRRNSTVATQSLLMMNSQLLADQAAKFAGRVRTDAAASETPLPPAPADKSDWNFANEVGRSQPAWQYGYGEFSESEQRLTAFTPLPHFTGSAWQGSAALPDPSLGWVTINANGGHPGDAAHSPIRRWIAPAAGRLTIEGQLSHPSESGDGVRGRVVVGGDVVRGEWLVHHGSAATAVATFDVEADQTVDFVIDCRDSVTSDSFHWTVKLSLESPAGGTPSVWESAGGFQGPQALSTPPPLPPQIALAWQLAYHRPITTEEMQTAIEFVTVQSHRLSAAPNQVKQADVQWQAMAHLCQMLLASNEFLYVD
ncbi:MAG: DUF1553 domain-containing protein, partial [Planctomycetales bacterium]|nr:DUF1553 domain-containing protein [Planctomycetales bacterium]